MKKALIAAVAAATALSGVLPAGVAAAQPYYAQDRYRDSDRDGRSDASEWNRDRDRDGRPDQYDRRDDRRGYHHDNRRGDRELRYYGGRYGYNGYDGRWRTGQRYPYYNNRQYVISDYRAYNLPPPRYGYRYYRSDNGDVVMAAIASGVIGLIIGGALSDNDHEYPRYYEYPRY
jgi:Ni/Co efflux regulator RcnB